MQTGEIPMGARGNKVLRRYATLMAIVLFLSPLTWSQWDARPPDRLAALTSGPVAIPLVATLESLSVSALPAALPISASRSGIAPALTVTTAWTIRANFTTVRLSGSSRGFAALDRDPLSVSHPGQLSEFLPAATPTLSPYETDWPGIAQPIGATGRPGSRQDNVEFTIVRKDKSNSESPPSAIYVFAQAL